MLGIGLRSNARGGERFRRDTSTIAAALSPDPCGAGVDKATRGKP